MSKAGTGNSTHPAATDISRDGLLRHSSVERDEGCSQSRADDPFGTVQMGPPTGLGTLAAQVEPHQRGRGVLPIKAGVVRFEESGIECEVLSIIIDHLFSGRGQCLDNAQLTISPNLVDEYTPWIVTRLWRSFRLVASREHLARNLKRLRTAKGLSQEALADAAGIDRTYVSALERQKYSLSIDRLDQIASSLGVAPHVLLMPAALVSED